MKLLNLAVVLSFVLGSCFCSLGIPAGEADRCREIKDKIVVTYAPPGANNPYAFDHLPPTLDKAKAKGWRLLDNGCKEGSTLRHKGQRAIFGNDRSVLIIYDKQGTVAGLQRTIPKDIADSGGVVNYTTLSYTYEETIEGQKRYIFTVYFIDPQSICKTGRSESQLKSTGTLIQAYIWNGINNYVKPPNEENPVILKQQTWTTGRCVPGMGTHYYENARKNMSCSEQKPYFLTYDCDRIAAVGLFLLGNFTQEPRYEYVPESTLSRFIDPVPDCLNDIYKPNTNGITALHLYFADYPQNITCPNSKY